MVSSSDRYGLVNCKNWGDGAGKTNGDQAQAGEHAQPVSLWCLDSPGNTVLSDIANANQCKQGNFTRRNRAARRC